MSKVLSLLLLLFCLTTVVVAETRPRNPFAPLPGQTQEKAEIAMTQDTSTISVLDGYRIAGIMLTRSRRLAVLQSPDSKFQIVRTGDSIANLPVTEITLKAVTIGKEANAIQLKVAE